MSKSLFRTKKIESIIAEGSDDSHGGGGLKLTAENLAQLGSLDTVNLLTMEVADPPRRRKVCTLNASTFFSWRASDAPRGSQSQHVLCLDHPSPTPPPSVFYAARRLII